MALNIPPNQELYLIFEDGHSEKIIDGLIASTYKSATLLGRCSIETTDAVYMVEIAVASIEIPFKINTKENWYKLNTETDIYEPIDGVTYELKEKKPYIPVCPRGYDDCVWDPAIIKHRDPEWYKNLYGDMTPEEAIHKPGGCMERFKEDPDMEWYCYDDECK